MSLCVTAAGTTVTLAASLFTLSWIHTIERVPWEEDWRIERGRLVLTEARVKGSGAGMEPPAGAVLSRGWWRYRPDLPGQELLSLATSAAAAGGWRLCAGESCLTLGTSGADDGPIEISPCEIRSRRGIEPDAREDQRSAE